MEEGRVYLIAEGGKNASCGTIIAKNHDETGGRVHIFGDQVGLFDNAEIDISGNYGGGNLLFGGDYQGSNPEYDNAIYFYVGEDVTIKANAYIDGHGGKTIFWADEYAEFFGNADLRGGELGGDGGFVEISGKMAFEFRGIANRLAPNGQDGILLLDPADVAIQTVGPTTGTFSIILPTLTYSPGAAADILTVLDLDTTVIIIGLGELIIDTTGSGGSGNLTIADAISFSSTAKLTFNDINDILVSAKVENGTTGGIDMFSSGGTVTINADCHTRGDINIGNSLSRISGNVTIEPTGATDVSVLSLLGNVTIETDADVSIMGGALASAEVESTVGSVTIMAPTGNIVVEGGSGARAAVLATTALQPIDITCQNLTISAGEEYNAPQKLDRYV